jgi:TolA-binding protein
MKMTIKNIALSALAACTLAACSLDTTPTTYLDAENVYKDTKNAERVLAGSWNYIFNYGSTYATFGLAGVMLNDDFAGSDAVRTLSYGYSPSYNLTNGYSRGSYCSVLWRIAYDPINNCNGILKNIDEVSGTDTDKARIKAQAYATRGFCYMLLATHYAFAIDKDPDAVCAPIYTEPTTSETALTGNPAASVSEVYAQALSDLENALDCMPEGYSHGTTATDQYKIDYNVTLGLLARTHLYARNWQKAYDYACQLLAKNSYLMTEKEYKSGFSDYNNGEWLWSLSCTIEDNDPCYIFYFKDCTTSDGYTNLNTDPYFKEKFEEGDYRKDLFYWGYTAYGNPAMVNAKFVMQDVDNMLGDIVMMRTSEIYLIKAEAAARLGKTQEAQATLQTLRDARMKSGQATTVTATGEELVKEIWMERRKELWGEGFALTDLIRNQQSLERKDFSDVVMINGKEVEVTGHSVVNFPDKTEFVPNSKYYLFRIPESEELQNENLYSKYPRLSIYN